MKTMNLSSIFTAAWTAAREAAARFGGKARQFFALSLKAAYAAARAPKTLAEIAKQASDHAGVYAANVWNERRVYINFVGYNRTFAGDRNLKVFYDPKLGWVVEGTKGIISSAMRRSAVAFLATVGVEGRI